MLRINGINTATCAARPNISTATCRRTTRKATSTNDSLAKIRVDWTQFNCTTARPLLAKQC